MKKEFFEAIRTGRKTTTLRYWRRPMVGAGSVHSIRGLGAVRIEEVLCLDENSLTAEDARADGFARLIAMRQALASLYPPSSSKGRKLYRLRFSFLGDIRRRMP